MSFDLWNITGLPFFSFPANFVGYVILLGYTGLLLFSLFRTLNDLLKLTLKQWGLLFVLIISAVLLISSLALRFPNTISPPDIPVEPRGPSLSLLGYSPLILAAGLLGTGPALLVGFAAGMARAGWETYKLTTIFETAFAAGLLSWLIRQDYRGLLAKVMRLPVSASVGTALAIWLLTFFSFLANSPTLGVVGLEYVTGQWLTQGMATVGELVIAGIGGTIVAFVARAWWVAPESTRAPLYATSLNRRLLFTLAPLIFLGLLFLIWANLTVANTVATNLIVEQMGRDAQTVANSVPYFIQTGHSTLRAISTDPHFQQPTTTSLTPWLPEQIRAVPYFRQLAYFDIQGKVVAVYPSDSGLANSEINTDEARVLNLGIPQTVVVYPKDVKESAIVSFIAPIIDERTKQPNGALVGRAEIEVNPLLTPAIKQLQSLKSSGGRGLIVDERQNIIYDSNRAQLANTDRAQLLQTWTVPNERENLTTSVVNGIVYRDRGPGNTRRLVYSYPTPGYAWTIIIILPNEVVLNQAAQITTPLMIILIAIGTIGTIIVLVITSRITSPIQALAVATARIAQGEFDRPVKISGEDEVGRLGIAFERMRERLRGRLSELNLLLQINQGIAASLDLKQSLPPLLTGALNATNGGGVRLVLPHDDGQRFVLTAGALSNVMQVLDDDLLRITPTEGRLVLENLNRARTIIEANKAGGKINALIALPLRQENRYLGLIWIGFDKPHTFTEAEVNFVSTLAGQAALAVANSHLYETSEDERQRLQAILSSSPDAIIVTDRRERILLINPATETIFSVNSLKVMGQPLTSMIDRPELLEVMRGGAQLKAPSQVMLADGRTMFASTSPIRAADHSLLGQVTVLRDVSYFKQLDELKSEFVATVSHDLRVPLTFMKGYATMLTMVGQLNPKQEEFNQKILIGIQQMSELVDDLLDLNRIEAGVGWERETCAVDDLVNTAVTNMRNNATNKEINLTVQIAANLPPILGDNTLLRQALSNLVDNAIKYTNNRGAITVSAEKRDPHILITVQDTGIGIATSDQARLFEKFFRVKHRETNSIKGSGLGLAIVKSIIERHGGRIWLESRLGQGSTFYIALPF